jgi:hypothetical protein
LSHMRKAVASGSDRDTHGKPVQPFLGPSQDVTPLAEQATGS